MKRVVELLERKGREVWSIDPAASVFEAIQLMAVKGVGALVVRNSDGAVVGMLSERDYARKVILEGRSSRGTAVQDIMTRRVVYARLDQEVEECLAMMTDKRIRHLPVMEEERLVGIVSIGDLVKAIIDEQRFMIEQLEQYIRQ